MSDDLKDRPAVDTAPSATWSAAGTLEPRHPGGRRVLVLGWAPLPFENARMNYAPGARAWQLARPLAAAGHAVCLGLARIPGAYDGDPPAVAELCRDGILIYLLGRDLFSSGDALDRLVASFAPDVVVGATAVPSRRAAEVAGERPLWVDFFGDPMAEAQAKAAVHPDGDHLTAYWRLTADLLERGDAFSAVSERQRLALIGQLGLAGRLNRATCGHQLVHTVPLCAGAADRVSDAVPPEELDDGDFVVLWSGGYNTWCDVETLFRALERAMEQNGAIRFVSTGGGIEGQDVTTYGRFRELVAGSRFGDRFHLKGRLPERRAAGYLARADLGVVTEKPIAERLLGGSARLLGWMSAGLPFVCARLSEVSVEAEGSGLGTTYPPGDAEALAERILAAAGRGRRPRRRPGAELLDGLTAEATTRPLVAWVAEGGRAPDHGQRWRRFLDPEAVERVASAEQLAAAEARAEKFERRYHRVRDELGKMHESKMWRLWMSYLALRRAVTWPLRWLSGGAPILALLLLAGLFLAAGCSPPGKAEPEARPNVVLIVIDTFRPDHLGINGYRRATAPFLEGLLERSTVFPRASSTSSWTAPATSSLFTGLYPPRHGVTEGFLAYRQRSQTVEELLGQTITLNRLPADVATLPELLKRAGYGTFGLATNINIGPEIGFDRGFDRFEKMTDRSARKVAERLQPWHDELLGPRPSFLYLHFNDVHEPYQPRAPWYRVEGDELARTVSAYDSEISFLDRVIEELYGELGWDRGTLLVVVSDHGEEFREHGQIGHQFTLYQELTGVLLAFSGEDLGIPAAAVEMPASLIDVAPTILGRLGIPAPADRDGRSLARFLVAGGRPPGELAERTLFAHRLRHRTRSGRGLQHLWAAVRGPWKLIEHPSGGRLYHLEEDPAEKHNRLEEHPEIAAELRRELDHFRAQGFRQNGDEVEIELDRETLERLKSLGYVE